MTAPGGARLLLLAPPGAGKSTHGRLLAEAFAAPHISTGELLRAEIAAGSELGRRVEGLVAEGRLVPDDLVVEMVVRRLTEPAPVEAFVLDGFPRTLAQAELGYAWASEHGLTFSAVLHLEVPEAELARRAAGRAAVSGRGDDNAATWERRMAEYRLETEPLLGFYRARGILVEVDAGGGVSEVHQAILTALWAMGLRPVRPARPA
ncbi:MAG: adenylate kinase [Acidobacteriota bacterium]|nr:adenylate kinase [Acidobacteriota bacterium]